MLLQLHHLVVLKIIHKKQSGQLERVGRVVLGSNDAILPYHTLDKKIAANVEELWSHKNPEINA